MKAAVFALVALLAVQAASAGWKKESKDSYSKKDGGSDDGYGASSGGDGYAAEAVVAAKDNYAKTKTVKRTVAVEGAPVAVERTESCRAAMRAVTEESTLSCGDGYTSSSAGDKMSCTRKVCHTPHPVAVEVEEEVAVDAYAGHADSGSDGYGSSSSKGGKFKKADKYGWFKKESKDSYSKKDNNDDGYGASSGGDGYGAEAVVAAKDNYAKTKTVKKIVMVEQAEVCSEVSAAPRRTCAKGTMSGHVCVVGAARDPCPEGYTAAGDLCTKSTTVMVKGKTTYVTVEEEVAVDAYAGDSSSDDGYGSSSSKGGKYAKKGWFSKKSKSSPASKDSYASSVKACPSAPVAAKKAETKAVAVVVVKKDAKP